MGAFVEALKKPESLAVIAEFKRRSPFRGWINQDADLETYVRAYTAGGAAAISVLVDERFGGSIEHLIAARGCTHLPVLAKGFFRTPAEIERVRAAGADAALLISGYVKYTDLIFLSGYAKAIGLDALIETHTYSEVWAAITEAQSACLGINSRDLNSGGLDVRRHDVLRRRLGETPVVTVAESGLSPTDLPRIRAAGFDAALIGDYIMRCHDPGLAVADLVAAASVVPNSV